MCRPAGEPSPRPPVLQRAEGVLRVAVAAANGRTRIARLRQQGCLKALLPRVAVGAATELVLLNTAGGIAAGDRHDGVIACGEATSLIVTGQAAERCYRARQGEAPARVAMSVTLRDAAAFEWLPQELILFDGASLERRLDIAMPRSASLLCLESRVFGRVHSGETLHALRLHDRLTLCRDGKLTLVEAFRMHGDAAALLARPAIGGGAVASATVVYAHPELFEPERAARRLAAVRSVLEGEAAGASAWNGMLVARIMSRDASRHRAAVWRLLAVLRHGRPPPSVWRC